MPRMSDVADSAESGKGLATWPAARWMAWAALMKAPW